VKPCRASGIEAFAVQIAVFGENAHIAAESE
jgi:hypothetical protein